MRKSWIILLIIVSWMGCSKDKNPLPSKSHPDTWSQAESPDFHGKKVLETGLVSCTSCHGADFTGGESHISCYSCHETYPHATGWVTIASADFHGESIRADNWSMETCKGCHGDDYGGGKAEKSCMDCHVDENGPEACNVCHGSQNNIYPPEDLSNNIDPSAMGVGAHELHMSKLGNCSLCHEVPETVGDPGHIDDTPYAEVKAAWGWDRNTGTCTSACHTDTTKTYIWNNF